MEEERKDENEMKRWRRGEKKEFVSTRGEKEKDKEEEMV